MQILLPPYGPEPRHSLFQSIDIKTRWEPIKGLIIGLEWNLRGCTENPFNIADGYFEYIVYQKDKNNTYILPESENLEKLTTAIHLFPEVILPKTQPKYKIGETVQNEEYCYVICSCEWGDLDPDNNFVPGWNYLTYWISDKMNEHDMYWDTEGQYSEKQLIEMQ